MRPRFIDRLSSCLISGFIVGFLVAGSSAFAQNGGLAAGHGSFGGARGSFGGVHSGFSGHPGGLVPHSFGGPAFGSPGRISTLAPHSIAMPGRAVFPAPAHAFAAGSVPNWTGSRTAQPFGGWSNGGWRDGGWRDGDHRRDHDGDHDRGHHRGDGYGNYGYGGYGYLGGYPYYANSWELLPYDIGGSDFMGDDTDQTGTQQGNAQSSESVPPPDSGYRPEYSGNDEPPYPVQQAYAAPSAPAAPIAPEPELTLIFKDGHTQAIRNYVLTPSDLVVLDQAAAGRQQRIPLHELNLPATEKAAQQAGVDFSPPA